MKKGFERWEVYRATDHSRQSGGLGDYLGTVDAKDQADAMASAYAQFSLRTPEQCDGIYVRKAGY